MNCKVDHALDYYIRDMQTPHLGLGLPFESNCIRSCFEKQLNAKNNSYASTGPEDDKEVVAQYQDSNWDAVLVALTKWLYLYLNDSDGLQLKDPTAAFTLTDPENQTCFAEQFQQEMKALIGEATIQLAVNENGRFFGCVYLFDAGTQFFELRLGTHF